jgi:hypothetical protein
LVLSFSLTGRATPSAGFFLRYLASHGTTSRRTVGAGQFWHGCTDSCATLPAAP